MILMTERLRLFTQNLCASGDVYALKPARRNEHFCARKTLKNGYL